ncbi:MAG: CcoQ/FixQ family Cbb3-type cytochrome c oxidase assembly chaperone [Gammaproteobacteria bacterium]|nr:CcoQ/FixQ family Cbb3-type cytochrome c oxidase assembly chaperone [Gammaproteobacteria bacterium]
MFAATLMFVLECATFSLIVAIAIWAFHPRRRAEFEQAAQLPFRFDDEPAERGALDR